MDPAIEPLFMQSGANEPIRLLKGRALLEPRGMSFPFFSSEPFAGSGELVLEWSPSPRLMLHTKTPGYHAGNAGHTRVSFSNPLLNGVGTILRMSMGRNTYASTAIEQLNTPGSPSCSRVVFYLANFPSFGGSSIYDPGSYGTGGWTQGRVRMDVDGWLITLDSIPGAQDVFQQDDMRGKYLLSHVGCIERPSDSSFRATDATPVLDALGCYFSFLAGLHTPAILATGLNARNNKVWRSYASVNVSPWRKFSTWVPRQSSDESPVTRLFASFFHLYSTKKGQDLLSITIDRYVEAINSSYPEVGIFLLTYCLEYLGSHVCCATEAEEEAYFSKRHPAPQRIKKLVDTLGIGTTIHPSLRRINMLGPFADGASAIVELRNGISHPNLRHRAPSESRIALHQVRNLARWWFELALLKALNYQGQARCWLDGRLVSLG